MPRKSNSISVLEFDEHAIAWLRVRRSPKGLEVDAFEVERGRWSASDGSLENALRRFVEARPIAADTVHTVLPRHEMTARILLLPSHSPLEIDGMIRLSLEEYVPYPETELVIDHCILQKLGDGRSRVFAVFAHRDVVESHVAHLRACGIEPEHIGVSTACLASAAIHSQAGLNERIALVNLASGGLEVLVLHGGRLEYGRAVATQQDWQTIADVSSDAAAELSAEVRASLAAYRRESESGEPVDAVYFCSDAADPTAAAAAVAAETGLDCRPAAFLSQLCTRGAEAIPTLPLALLGAALDAQGRAALRVSLVPQSLLQARRRKALAAKARRLGGLAAAALLAACATYANAVYQRTSYIRSLESRIAAIEREARAVEARKKQILRLKQHLDRSGSALELLARLTELAPPSGLNITRFSFTHGQGITIEGRTQTEGLVYEFTEALRRAGAEGVPQFARALAGGTRPEVENNQNVVHFQIVIQFPESETETAEREPET